MRLPDRLFDRSGKCLGTVGAVADNSNPALSPDGNRLAVSIRDPATGSRDIWIFDLLREAAESRITFESSDDSNPVWSPDGGRIAYSSDRRAARDIYIKSAAGAGGDELVIESKIPKNVEDWSADGRWMVYNEAVPNYGDDLVVLPLDTRKPPGVRAQQVSRGPGPFFAGRQMAGLSVGRIGPKRRLGSALPTHRREMANFQRPRRTAAMARR